MYLSRVELEWHALPVPMQVKAEAAGLYAAHQWLWQLFPDQAGRTFLFRQERQDWGLRFYLLSPEQPKQDHPLLRVASKSFAPQLGAGQALQFSLRANPVITRQGRRSDVLMDAKFHAPADLDSEALWQVQQQAAKDWLLRQADRCGFAILPEQITVTGYRQQYCDKPKAKKPIRFSSVDFDGLLTVTDPALFLQQVGQGLGKSRGLGCGLMLLRKPG